ncbi:hypothetical protein [Parendozoicomonas sp. Alg238-R29]|uniref:hypothetical protein n=1 Tax=Parendozoicomonas sp. Alg238-R29 TaxID=2993446 RepID=UPI00248DA853|nr:hypothetical protein [Parendozoicomonas sp. Alg238-R29]
MLTLFKRIEPVAVSICLLVLLILSLCVANTALAATTRAATTRAATRAEKNAAAAGASSQAATVKADVSSQESDDSDKWSWFAAWIERTPDYSDMKARAAERGIDMIEVSYPAENAPAFYHRLESMHGLMMSFRTHLLDWLRDCDFKELHLEGGYSAPKLPEDADKGLRVYLLDRDPLLIISMAYMIHLIRSNESKLTETELLYFELCLEWMNTFLFPDGLTPIEWEEEYQQFIDAYNIAKGWSEAEFDLPVASSEKELEDKAAALDADSAELIEKYLFLEKYPHWSNDDLELRTVWDAVRAIDENDMHFELASDDKLFLKDYGLFVLKLALMSPYLHDSEKALTRFWLKLSEIRVFLSSGLSEAEWRQTVRKYTPAGCDDFHKKAVSGSEGSKKRLREPLKRRRSRRLLTMEDSEPEDNEEYKEVAKAELPPVKAEAKVKASGQLRARKSHLLEKKKTKTVVVRLSAGKASGGGGDKAELAKLLDKPSSTSQAPPASQPVPSKRAAVLPRKQSPGKQSPGKQSSGKQSPGSASLTCSFDDIVSAMNATHGVPKQSANKVRKQAVHEINQSAQSSSALTSAKATATSEKAGAPSNIGLHKKASSTTKLQDSKPEDAVRPISEGFSSHVEGNKGKVTIPPFYGSVAATPETEK